MSQRAVVYLALAHFGLLLATVKEPDSLWVQLTLNHIASEGQYSQLGGRHLVARDYICTTSRCTRLVHSSSHSVHQTRRVIYPDFKPDIRQLYLYSPFSPNDTKDGMSEL